MGQKVEGVVLWVRSGAHFYPGLGTRELFVIVQALSRI